MKLQFKEQDFQVKAVKAVVDVFAGQPRKTNKFTLERSRNLIKKAKEVATGTQTLQFENCLLYTSPSPRDRTRSRMPSSA